MTGLTATRRVEVTSADTAQALDESLPAVASTPFILAIAELTCHDAIAASLEPGMITLGSRGVIEHVAPTLVGRELRVEAVVDRIDGRSYGCTAQVFEGDAIVARVEHTRNAVSAERLERRLAEMRAER